MKIKKIRGEGGWSRGFTGTKQDDWFGDCVDGRRRRHGLVPEEKRMTVFLLVKTDLIRNLEREKRY